MGSQRELKIKRETRRWLLALARKGRKFEFHRTRRPAESKKATRVYRSSILDLFAREFDGAKKSGERAPKRFVVPREFSLTDNPDESLRLIRDVVRYSRLAKKPRLILDHRQIRKLGLGAEALLAVILKEISLEAEHVPGAYIKGYKPSNRDMREMMDDVGCVRVLGSGEEEIQVSIKSTAQVFRHQNRGKKLAVDPLQRDDIARLCADFSDHVDRCLGRVRKRLTPSGREKLTSHMGEVVINAQEHSGTAQWLVVGYLNGAELNPVYRAVILSFGNTIAENFEAAPENSVARRLVRPYIEIHDKRKLFGQNWTRSDLLTVIALQGNVSSQLDEDENSDRGQGTVDLIQFFQGMAAACNDGSFSPSMSLISGKTHVSFDGSRQIQYEPTLNRMVIAFNDNNNLLEPPDSREVYRMAGEGFPGVAVSIMVPLAKTAVEDLPGEH